MLIKLSENERNVLTCAQHKPQLSVPELSSILSLKHTTVRNCLSKLKNKGILRRGLVADYSKLGLRVFHMILALDKQSRKSKMKILEMMKKCPFISWLAEIGGGYQIGFTYLSKNSDDFNRFFELILEQADCFLADRALVNESAQSYFGTKFLTSKSYDILPLSYDGGSDVMEVDEKDHSILWSLCNMEFNSLSDISKHLGLPNTTVEYRIKRLKEKGIIKGLNFVVDLSQFNVQVNHLLLTLRTTNDAFKKDLMTFCMKHKNIKSLIRSVGKWDIKLIAETERVEELSQTLDAIREKYGEYVSSVEAIPIYKVHKWAFYPYNPQSFLEWKMRLM